MSGKEAIVSTRRQAGLRARRAQRRLGRRYRRATSFARVLPNFLIIGASKAGTTSLYSYLVARSGVLRSATKEVRYFDRYYSHGPAWYRAHFPLALTELAAERRLGIEPAIGDASPHYLVHPLAAARAHNLMPDVRLIALLRDPVDRALSHYHHERCLAVEPLSFEEAIEREPERLAGEAARLVEEPGYWSPNYFRFSYLTRGLYAEQLERWLLLFPQEQLLVLGSEDLFRDPGAVASEVLRFLGIPISKSVGFPVLNARDYPPMADATRERLVEYFDEPNRRLYELLDRDLGWSRPAS